VPSDDGGLAPRGRLLYSEPRRAPSPGTGDKPWLTHRARDTHACQTLGRRSCACEAEAPHARLACARGLEPPTLHQPAVHPMGRDAQRGRPGPDAQPAPVVYQRQGALASARATREARLTPHRWFILATNALDERLGSPQARLDGDNGQRQAERGCRVRKAPRLFAASRSRKQPERSMARLLVRTGGWFV
jgi:hypothetical protein